MSQTSTSTALAPVVKAPIIQTSINMSFSTDDMVHLAVEQQTEKLKKELDILEKALVSQRKISQAVTENIIKKKKEELVNLFKEETDTIRKMFKFPKFEPYIQPRVINKKRSAVLDLGSSGLRLTKPLSKAYISLEKEYNEVEKPVNEAYKKWNECRLKMCVTTLTQKAKAKIAKIKLQELKAQGVDFSNLVDLS